MFFLRYCLIILSSILLFTMPFWMFDVFNIDVPPSTNSTRPIHKSDYIIQPIALFLILCIVIPSYSIIRSDKKV